MALPPKFDSLGPQVAHYKGRTLIYAILIGLGGFVLFAVTLVILLFTGTLFYVLAGVGGLMMLVGALDFVRIFMQGMETLTLHEKGFVLGSRGKQRVVLWDDITAILHSISPGMVGTNVTYKLGTTEGPVELSGSRLKAEDVAAVGRIMQDRVARRLVPDFAARIDSGETVRFGVLSLSRQGIGSGDSELAWPEVAGVTIQNHTVHITKLPGNKAWVSMNVGAVPNAQVFVTLASRIKPRPA